MTNPDIQQAKEWAESRAYGNYALSEETLAAVKVIQSLPGQWVGAEELREQIEKLRQHASSVKFSSEACYAYHRCAEALESLLPTPPLPTLADMTHEEREACQWMQADFHGSSGTLRVVITRSNGATVDVLLPSGAVSNVYADTLTPLPGEPKLKWPGGGVEDSSVADSGEPVMMPRPEDVKPGDPWLVEFDGDEWVGVRSPDHSEKVPWAIIRMDGLNYGYVADRDTALISRMVREVPDV